jgi:hypothetical protein
VPLTFTRAGNDLSVQVPASGAVLPPGYYMLTIVDSNGVPSVSSTVLVGTTVVADTQPPTVALSAPANGATVQGTVSVTATASDNQGVASVGFTVDGNPLGAPDTTAPYSATWDTTSVVNGQHVLAARATDTSGNVATAPTRTITVANPSPAPTTTVRCALACSAIYTSRTGHRPGTTGLTTLAAGVLPSAVTTPTITGVGSNSLAADSANVVRGQTPGRLRSWWPPLLVTPARSASTSKSTAWRSVPTMCRIVQHRVSATTRTNRQS